MVCPGPPPPDAVLVVPNPPTVVNPKVDLAKIGRLLKTKKRPSSCPPTFVCPPLFSWADRNSTAAAQWWHRSGLNVLFQADTVAIFAHRLATQAFIQISDDNKRFSFLEDALTTVLIPLLGDTTRTPPKIETEYARQIVIASLLASGATDVDKHVAHALQLKQSEHNTLLTQRRWGLDLVRARRCKIGQQQPQQKAVPPPPLTQQQPETLTKTELLDLQGTLAAKARLEAVLAKLRARSSSTREDLHQMERVKKKLDFLKAVLAAGVRDEASNTLRNTVTYRKRTPIGRYQPRWPSLTHCPSTLRGELCTQHSDVDMKNCHPVLLVQMARRANFPVPRLDEYVRDRQRILAQVSNYYGGLHRKWVKELFLRVINGGGLARWIDKIEDEEGGAVRKALARRGGQHAPFVLGFMEEVSGLREVVIGLQPGAEAVLAAVQAGGQPHKNRWSLFSWCLTEVESACLLAAADYFERVRHIPVDTLVFDGAIVRCASLCDDDLKKCEDHVYNRTSWRITLVCKPFPTESDPA